MMLLKTNKGEENIYKVGIGKLRHIIIDML